MNAITKALSEIKYSIPIEVLNIGFMENNSIINTTLSIDEMMMNKVIRPRVLTDCNITGGVMTLVNLDLCKITYLANQEVLINVPKSLTNNNSIISALSLVANGSIKSNVGYNLNMSPLLSTASNMMNSLNTEVIIQTSRLEVIGENTILIAEYNLPIISGVLRCMVENNHNMTNLNPRAYLVFSELVILAIKAYIYNTTVIRLDKGYLYAGHDLGTIKDIIDGYSDANEMYTEYLRTKYQKVSFTSDGEAMDRFVKSMLSSVV